MRLPCADASDWVVLRVKPQYHSLVDGAVAWATAKANDPNVRYIADNELEFPTAFLNPTNKSQDTRFYCSLFVWRAFYQQGLDLDHNGAALPFDIPFPLNAALAQQVRPDDLYASAFGSSPVTTVVQDLHRNQRRLFIGLFSPANIRLQTANGDVTGIDPITGSGVNDIPQSFYSGPNTEPQWISIPNISGASIIEVHGTGTGLYSLAVQAFGNGTIQLQTFQGNTQPGQIDTFTVSDPNLGSLQLTNVSTTSGSPPPTATPEAPSSVLLGAGLALLVLLKRRYNRR